VDSVFHRDYPVAQTIITIMAVKFVFINLIVDLLYGLIDPRIRYA
jgi:ABC-type dipeptide/oligopeptide/nickel transport system permease component